MSTQPGIRLEGPFFLRLKDGRTFYVQSRINSDLETVCSIHSVSSIATDSVCLGEFSSYKCDNGTDLRFYDREGNSINIIPGPHMVDIIARVIL
ncbi:MAG: hypothetical protein MNSN_02890 [Minisyncoccus archaeiphilus]|jgi:hypothetical protein|uniref:hypothetical protein n=1 Tax=Minisyncoccus archaeiphilus TaxID=3238481 RepID=UPI002B0C5C3D|nr:MAG: hypothetical protein MNSN_02890 [Candidatus Parcubacteria bacterium]